MPEIGEKSLDCIENEFKFEKMTPVQAAAIPLFLSHRDVLVQACTGSGKTIAFLLPIFEILSNLEDPLKSFEIGALILSPTRELATQIYQVAQRFAMENYFSNIKILLLVGGSGHEEDIIALNESAGANIVIGTPGRIEAALTKTNLPISTKRLEMLVMDEADRLLDMGFQVSLNNILRILPKQRRTGLFSATMTSDLHELAKAGLRNPATIHVKVKSKNGNADTGDQSIPIGLANFYEIVPVKNKLVYLLDFLTSHQENKVIVFVLTKAQVDYFGALLSNSVVDLDQSAVFCIHGSMPQKKRNSVYSKFRDCPKGVLLCTDLVARGVDIPEVDWILQFDPPQDPSYFIHRVGRTARMGKKGSALVLLDPTEDTYIGESH